LDFRSQLLDPARNELGRIALATVSVVNDQQHKGLDLKGDFGGDLFSVGGAEVLSSKNNTSGVQPTATRTGIGSTTTSDYILSYAGGTWALRNAATGAAVTMAGSGTSADPFTAEGLSIVVPAGALSGDSFKIRPVASAIAGFSVLINDPARIAAAAPMLASASTANKGDSAITAGEVLDPANANLQATTQIQFIDATHYSVNGSGSFGYTAGANIDMNGWRAVITGTPAAGDSFTIASNAAGVGDNRNALSMAQLLGDGVLEGGGLSINGATSRFVGSIGVATGQAQTSLDAQKVIVDNTTAAANAVSGVNLDEEAANMLRFQQNYQAMAQIIRVTQSIFDSLLQATSR
jgi:flagellar hook-associated protein 1 FlgK